jgi:hypothetical protein
MPGIINETIEQVPIGSLKPHPRNPRRGDVGAIQASIGHHGFYGAVVAQRSTRRILAGNHRWLAAQAAGLTEVPVAWVDVDDEQTQRRCRAIELEPIYVDVAIKRWQDQTGQEATLDGDGRTFAEVAAERR